MWPLYAEGVNARSAKRRARRVVVVNKQAAKLPMPEVIKRLPFPNYLIPGIILILGMSVLPLLTTYTRWFHPIWRWAHFLISYLL